MTLSFHSGLSKDLSLILYDADDFDAVIQVGENQDVKEFHAHSVILRARSPYFKSALSTRWITKKNNTIMFNKPNITPTVFDMVLKYIYTGELDLTEQPCKDVLELLVASDELLLEELFQHVQDYLIEKQSTWVQQNFVLVLHTIFELPSCKKLQDHCIESICMDSITSDNLSLNKDILYELLKQDDSLIEETIAWDYLIKWGIERTPGLENKNSDGVLWNNNDYEALKQTLNQFIPLIRFVELSPAYFFDKVRPYKAIVPKQIYEEVEEFYFKGTLSKITTLPPRKIRSKIIKSKLSSVIVNWIGEKNSDPRYTFKLIYRKSRDGINNIRDQCAGQGAVLILIKVRNTDKIFGGYNPVGWVNNTSTQPNNPSYPNSSYIMSPLSNLNPSATPFYSNTSISFPTIYPSTPLYPYVTPSLNISSPFREKYISTTESFIFSFENDEDNKDMKISRVIEPSRAIFDNKSYGINFGGGDLALENDYLSLGHVNYENLINRRENEENDSVYDEFQSYFDGTLYAGYLVEEIEVFSVNNCS